MLLRFSEKVFSLMAGTRSDCSGAGAAIADDAARETKSKRIKRFMMSNVRTRGASQWVKDGEGN
jgi:hypothetical protein